MQHHPDLDQRMGIGNPNPSGTTCKGNRYIESKLRFTIFRDLDITKQGETCEQRQRTQDKRSVQA